MTLHKMVLTPGINKDATPTAGKGGWYDADKVRFLNGQPQKIGGWRPLTTERLEGTARSLILWVTLDSQNLLGIGTSERYYLEAGGVVNDITPIRKVEATASIISSTAGSNRVIISAANHLANIGDLLEISGSAGVGGIPGAEVNAVHTITATSPTTVSVDVLTAASTTDTDASTVTVNFLVNRGLDIYIVGVGWGADGWSDGAWGTPGSTGIGKQLTLWNNATFGQTLLYGPRGGALYKYDPVANAGGRGVLVTGSDVPIAQSVLIVSDVSRFALVMGTNDLGDTVADPLLIRWSDQEDYTNWTPSITNQAGSQRLSQGSYIVTALQTRQELLVWTDNALYSMQYVGPPWVWGIEMQMNNLSIMSPRAAVSVNNLTFWMGANKFYVYSGKVDTLPCPLSTYIFSRLNKDQAWQVFAGTNENFNEIWWFYCSEGSLEVDSYVIYNHMENVWSHGSMRRTAWHEGLGRPYPMATTQDGLLLYHEIGNDDAAVNPPQPIEAYIQSSDVDIGDGEDYAFVWRIIPDLTFMGSDAAAPKAYMGILPRKNPGVAYGNAPMMGVEQIESHPVEEFTEYIYTRVRGRQLAFRISSSDLGTHWRLGAPRVDIRPDGRKT